MPIKFEQSANLNIETNYKDGMDKLFKDYPISESTFEQYKKIENGFWVYAIFNERIVGAMFLEKQNGKTCIAHYLAVRKPTQNRGIGRELVNRWASLNGFEIEFSEELAVVLGQFR